MNYCTGQRTKGVGTAESTPYIKLGYCPARASLVFRRGQFSCGGARGLAKELSCFSAEGRPMLPKGFVGWLVAVSCSPVVF